MNKNSSETLQKIFDILEEQQSVYFDRIYPILSKTYNDTEIFNLLISHYIDVLAQAIATSDEDIDVEYCKYALDTLIDRYQKRKDEENETNDTETNNKESDG